MPILERLPKPVQLAITSLALASCSKEETPPDPIRSSTAAMENRVLSSTTKNFDAQAVEVRQVQRPISLAQIAASQDVSVEALDRWSALNGIHRDTSLVPGSLIRYIRADYKVPSVDTERGVDPKPIVVSLQKGQTLWELSRQFKVPLEALVAINCSEGEREVRNLQIGKKITIPMVQVFSREDGMQVLLEGLHITDPQDCERVARRLVKCEQGGDVRRVHLATCFQHFSPDLRRHVVECIAAGLDAVAEHDGGQIENGSSTGIIAKQYAEALRAAVGRYSIDNPFRVSPISLLEIITNRQRLEAGSPGSLGEKVALVFTSDGDANGAFTSINKVIETAMRQDVSVVYFQTGSCSDLLRSGESLTQFLGRGVDYLVVGGHGGAIAKGRAALLELGYSSTVRRAYETNSPAIKDLQISGDNTGVLRGLASLMKPGGSIGFVSCYSGQGRGQARNLVNGVVAAAGVSGYRVHVLGCEAATNVAEINFNAKGLDIRYCDGGTYEMNSAVAIKKRR